MLLLTATVLFLLAGLNYRLGGRYLFHPAVVFCSVWAFGVFLIWVMGDFFYPISPETLLIFMGGALAFSLGSAVVNLYPRGDTKPLPAPTDRIINTSIVLIICATPLALRWMIQQIAEHPHSNWVGSAYITMLDEKVQATLGYTLFGNLVIFSNMIALAAFCERDNHKKRWWLAFFLTLSLNLLMGSRSGIVTLIFALPFLDWLKTRRLRWKLLLGLGTLLFILVSTVAIYLGKGEARADASLRENAVPVMHGLTLYAVGAAVAFDKVVQDPTLRPHNFEISVFFVETLNKFGANLEHRAPATGYVDIGPNNLTINIYSIYYMYFELGYPAMMAIMILLGLVTTIYFMRALAGNPVSTIMYAALFSCIVLSLYAEYFFHSLNYLLKLYVVVWMIYRLPYVWRSFSRFLRQRVERQLAGAGQIR